MKYIYWLYNLTKVMPFLGEKVVQPTGSTEMVKGGMSRRRSGDIVFDEECAAQEVNEATKMPLDLCSVVPEDILEFLEVSCYRL